MRLHTILQADQLCKGDLDAAALRRALIRDMWRGRLRGVQRNVDTWQQLLSVRALVLPMHEVRGPRRLVPLLALLHQWPFADA